MLSIGARVNSFYTQNSRTSNVAKQENSSASASLTKDELKLAKEYKEFLDFSEALFRKAKGEAIDEDQHELIYGEKRPGRFDNVLSFNGIQTFDMSGLHVDKTSRPSYGLPKQEFSFNAAANSINLGEGSKIPLGGHYLYVFGRRWGKFEEAVRRRSQKDV